MNRLFALLLALALPSFAAELHEVRFHRPHKAGEKYSASVIASVDGVTAYSSQGRVVGEKKVDASCSVEGEFEILQVDANGRVTSASMKITKSDAKVDGSATNVFKVGDVITSARGEKGEEDVNINGDKPSDVQLELARLLVSTSRPSKVTDDDVFGPGRSVGAGEQWPINSKAAVEDFVELGKLSPEHITGNVKLAGVEETEGQKCLGLRGQISIRGGGFNIPNTPDWMKVRTMEIEADLDASLPTDTSAVIPRSKMAMTMDVAASGEMEKDGEMLKFAFSMHRKQKTEQRYKPLK